MVLVGFMELKRFDLLRSFHISTSVLSHVYILEVLCSAFHLRIAHVVLGTFVV